LPKNDLLKKITVYCASLLIVILANITEAAYGNPEFLPMLDIRLFLPLAVYLLIRDEYIWALPVIIIIPYIVYPPSTVHYYGIIYRFIMPIISIGSIYLIDKALIKRRFLLRFFLSSALIAAAGSTLFVAAAGVPAQDAGRLVLNTFGIYAETIILTYTANTLYSLYKDKETDRIKYSIDELTGLYTGSTFERLCERELAKHKNKPAVLFMLDIDNMNFYNNNYGHETGNMCIALFANRIKEFVNQYSSSIAGRLSGDTMVVFVQPHRENVSIDDLINMFDKKTHNVKMYTENSLELNVTAATGMSVFGRDAKTLDELMSKADFAMREAKKNNSRKIELFDENRYQEFKKITSIAGSIGSIINDRMFSHIYQAIMSVETCEVAMYEALSRPHPSLNVNINTLLEIAQSIHKRMELEKEMLLSIIEDYKWHGKLNTELSINES
ncbi:MAG TPA: diguanylate cyclase, partial [Clostridia bacterium]|nr:diguanylate cyclase [Clostridia bacterium]